MLATNPPPHSLTIMNRIEFTVTALLAALVLAIHLADLLSAIL